MENIKDHFIKFVLQEQSIEKNIVQLSTFLLKYIPFNSMNFHILSKSSKLSTPVLVMKENGIMADLQTKNLITPHIDYELLFDGVKIFNDTSLDPRLKTYIYHPDQEAIMTQSVFINEDYSIFMTLCANQKNFFTEEHKFIFEQFRNVIIDLGLEVLQIQKELNKLQMQQAQKKELSFQLISNCKGLKEIVKKIQNIANTDYPVLILGETGVGKELIAESIRYLSSRNKEDFIKINCAAITESLLESELFGHEKGAFTSAINIHKGYFEQASNGTIFLDEIGEFSLFSQAKLLRVLEENSIRRIGGTKNITINTRIILATCQDLEEKVKSKQFRKDLWYRINVYPIYIPALRSRKEDIVPLANIFYEECANKSNFKVPKLNQENYMKLLQYDWPGNIRELKHCIERSILNSIDRKKLILDIPYNLENNSQKIQNQNISTEIINKALYLCKGRIQGLHGAANYLNMHPNTLRYAIQKLGLETKHKSRKEKYMNSSELEKTIK